MANQRHLKVLNRGVEAWNQWRKYNPDAKPDFSEAHLGGLDLRRANLSGADLAGADLTKADLSNAKLIDANLWQANLFGATLLETNLERANLSDCLVYGISAWDVQLDGAKQLNLVITRSNQPTITVDSLEAAQLIYLLLNSKKIRDVIDTITSKVVLILGRFTSERKVVLDALRDELRKLDYLPVLFDFNTPNNRNIIETIITLAHLSRFIIADITDPSNIPNELQLIVSSIAVPVQPLLQASAKEYGMFSELRRYPWVLPLYRYKNRESLIQSLKENVIEPAEEKLKEINEIVEENV